MASEAAALLETHTLVCSIFREAVIRDYARARRPPWCKHDQPRIRYVVVAVLRTAVPPSH